MAQAVHIPTRGACTPKVLYSIPTVALHLLAQGEMPSAKTRLVEVTREGAEGIANAQTLRMMGMGQELFDALREMIFAHTPDGQDALADAWWEARADDAAEHGLTSDQVRAQVRERARALIHKVIG